MKILFLNGNLEPGKDGVGDYTRKFAAGLVRVQQQAFAIAINDHFIDRVTEQTQPDGDVELNVLRIPHNLKLDEKMKIARDWIVKINPDWISLQYVPFSFDPKGLPKKWGDVFAKLAEGRQTQIMFHELWVGEENGVSFKTKLYGYLQRTIIKDLLKKIKPSVVNTSIELYGRMLSDYGMEGTVLPIFSNISRWQQSIDTFADTVPNWLKNNREQYIIGCNFGSFYQESWDLASFLPGFTAACNKLGKQPLIYSIGKIAAGKDVWNALPDKYPEIKFLTLGAKAEAEISYWLTYYTDFGIITTPAIIAGKSGAFMAFKEHGLSSFCNPNEFIFGFNISDITYDDYLVPAIENVEIQIPPKNNPAGQLKNTIELFLKSTKQP